MQAGNTARFNELVVSMLDRNRMEGIADDDRFQPFDMRPSIVEPGIYLGSDGLLTMASFGAQTMFVIAAACAYAHAVWRDDLEYSEVDADGVWWLPEESAWETLLPPVALEGVTLKWAARFLQCFADIRIRIFEGAYEGPLCRGEEMALLVVLNDARGFAEGDLGRHSHLPAIASADLLELLDEVRDTHFRDEHVVDLFDSPWLVGEPGAETDLHPDNWFVPFPAAVFAGWSPASSLAAVNV